jgi:hypothetical protein
MHAMLFHVYCLEEAVADQVFLAPATAGEGNNFSSSFDGYLRVTRLRSRKQRASTTKSIDQRFLRDDNRSCRPASALKERLIASGIRKENAS